MNNKFFKRHKFQNHQSGVKRYLLSFLALAFLSVTVQAGGLQIENIRFFTNQAAPDEPRVLFDLSWKNSWRNSRNHDAAWIFLKYPDERFDRHAHVANTGHRLIDLAENESPAPQIVVPADRKGFFIFPAANYRGNISWRLSVKLDNTGMDKKFQQIEPKVFGIEMVYIPAGGFTLGDPEPDALNYGSIYRSDARGEPHGLIRIASEAEIPVGPTEGALYYRKDEYHGDQAGPIPAAYPKGFRAFYTMKYELSQGQYADFLNSISDQATFYRVNFAGRSYYQNKGTIRLVNGRYVAGSPERPMNFFTWDDGLAFADWAALRPMTELEFTKASRGPRSPKPKEFPWGTSDTDQLARIVNRQNDLVFVNGWDESKLTNETLPIVGASYYWVMDLSGSIWERVITIGSPAGRGFAGSHGDGRVSSSNGRAENEDWPHTYKNLEGHGFRGGAFYFQGKPEAVFNPYSPVAYRTYGGWSGAYPHMAYGFRSVRTAPDN